MGNILIITIIILYLQTDQIADMASFHKQPNLGQSRQHGMVISSKHAGYFLTCKRVQHLYLNFVGECVKQ